MWELKLAIQESPLTGPQWSKTLSVHPKNARGDYSSARAFMGENTLVRKTMHFVGNVVFGVAEVYRFSVSAGAGFDLGRPTKNAQDPSESSVCTSLRKPTATEHLWKMRSAKCA